MIGAVGGGRRGAALGGFAVGMAVLGGEPVTAAIGFVPLLWLAVDNHGWRKGIVKLDPPIAAIGALSRAATAGRNSKSLRLYSPGGARTPGEQTGGASLSSDSIARVCLALPLR